MNNKDNGGPAFPSPEWSDAHGNIAPQEYGMTLRDWMAGMAMQGVYAKHGGSLPEWTDCELDVADACYTMADAMLKARNA